jgi:tetratricopeptide (TPR) repeat protein
MDGDVLAVFSSLCHLAANLDRAESMIATALSADPNDAEAHFVKGELLTYARKQFAAAVAELKVAIENDRNFAPAYAQYGANHWFIGKAAEVIPDIETALRLSPRDPMRNIWELFICHAHMHLAEWEQAVEWCEKSIATRATYWQAYVDLAAGGATRAMSEFRKRAAILAADSLACLGLAKRMSGDPYYGRRHQRMQCRLSRMAHCD